LPDDEDNNLFSGFHEPPGSGIPKNPLESAIAFVGANARTTGEESFGIRQQAAIIQEQPSSNGLRKAG
jgi:hypothetical protein